MLPIGISRRYQSVTWSARRVNAEKAASPGKVNRKGIVMSPYYAQTVDDLLADPLIQAVMRADRVEPDALKGMLTGVAARVGANRRALALAFDPVSVRFGAEARTPTPLRLAPPSAYTGGENCLCHC